MAEFKVNKEVLTQVGAVRTAANEINADYEAVDDDNVDTLKTAKKIVKQQKDLKKLMELYQRLLLRDMNDLDAMFAAAEQMDNTAAASYESGTGSAGGR